MHSWMDVPQGNTAYYGNALVHQNSFKVDEGKWVCLEVHVKLNSDLASGKGAMLEIWKNDSLLQSFGETAPKGYWIKDKFCPQGADGTECTDYPAPFDTDRSISRRAARRRFSSTTSGRRTTSRRRARRPGWSTTTW